MVRNGLLYFFVRAGNGLFAIATLAIFARLLSPAEYGVYALYTAAATVASAVLFQWVISSVGRFYPMHANRSGMVLAAAEQGFWAATAIAGLIFLGVLPFLESLKVQASFVGILFLLTVALGRYGLALQVANAQGATVQYVMLSWTKGGGALVTGGVLIYFGAAERGALIGLLTGLVFAAIVCAPKSVPRKEIREIDPITSWNMFLYGVPLTINYLAIVVLDVSDRFLIAGLLGSRQVASYAVAYDLVQFSIGPVMSVFFLALFPEIVHVAAAKEDESARKLLHILGSGLIFVGLPTIVGLAVLSNEISEIVIGGDYRKDIAVVMPYLAAAIFFSAFKNYFLDIGFQLRQATKYQGYIAILMAIVNVLLNLLFIPRFGVIAAAWATLAAFALGSLASWVFGSLLFKLPSVSRVLWGSALASSGMLLALYWLPSSSGILWLFTKIGCGIGIYSLLAWMLDVAGCRAIIYGCLSNRENLKIT